MDYCKYLPKDFDIVSECKNFLTNDEKKLLLDNLSEECFEFAEKLSLFLTEYSDMDFSLYFYRNYRKLMSSLHSASNELRIKCNGENVIISDIFGI